MGFSLGGFMSGAAGAIDSKMKNDKIEREAERSKVEDMIFKTSARLFENASLVQDSRTKDIKSNKKYMNTLVSMAPSIASDPAKQAFILGLDDEAREDLITMVNDPKFNPEKRPLADYLEAIDDPVEFKDPVTLSQRVQGVVTPRPMDSSAYYGVSTTKDKEVDKIVSSYTDSFAVAYGMTAAKAQGLLDAAKQEVKVQSFTIDWAHKKELGAADAALITAQVATAQLGTEKAKIAVVDSMETRYTKRLTKARDNFILSSGVPNEATFNADKNNQAAYLESSVYKAANESIISDAVLYMESHPILEEPTMRFLKDNYPGQYGGAYNKGDPVGDLKDDVYYRGEFGNGPGIAKGSYLKRMIAAAGAEGKVGGKGKVDVEDQTIVSEKDSTYVNPTPSTTGAATTAMSALQASHAALLEKKSTVATSRGGRGAVVTGANIKAIEADMATLEKDPTSLESVKILSTVALDSDSRDDMEQAIEAIKVYTEEHKSEIKRGDSIPELSTITSKLRAALAEDTEGTSRKRGRGLGERIESTVGESEPTPIRELTSYQQVMIDEKRGTIGAAKAYDQAVDIAVRSGDMATVRKIQSIISGLTKDQTGLGVSDMLDEITSKIESALNK
tara:strand:- start:834 stop:2690 length:1857 start_codon:yes stop_codon:yes gene_type:complete